MDFLGSKRVLIVLVVLVSAAVLVQSVQPPNGKQPLKPSDGNQPLNPPNAKQPLNPPNARQPPNPPNGKQPLNPPNGNQPPNPPNAKQPPNPPNANQHPNPPNGKQPLNPPNTKQPPNPPNGNQPPNPPNGKQPLNPPNTKQPSNPPNAKQPPNPPNGNQPPNPPNGKQPLNPPNTKQPPNPPNGKQPLNPRNPPNASHSPDVKVCSGKKSPCFGKQVHCPHECPSASPTDKMAKMCYLNCDSPICKAECKSPKPNCKGPGSACLDPRFIGGDGIVFYFHGKKNEYFNLVSDPNLQINSRFIGVRPEGRTRDNTWIQALGLLFDSNSFSLEASKASVWDDEIDHLKFTYNGEELVIPEYHLSAWESPEYDIIVKRTSGKNSALVTLPGVAEISVNVVPVTKEDDRIHNYQIPLDDCFAHLEIQFRFYDLSSNVEGVLGRTYQPDFKNPAKLGVAMPVVGGEDKYRTTSLFSADCTACVFTQPGKLDQTDSRVMDYGMLDCTGKSFGGNGIVCRK